MQFKSRYWNGERSDTLSKRNKVDYSRSGKGDRLFGIRTVSGNESVRTPLPCDEIHTPKYHLDNSFQSLGSRDLIPLSRD